MADGSTSLRQYEQMSGSESVEHPSSLDRLGNGN
jgi:hypothetical protein